MNKTPRNGSGKKPYTMRIKYPNFLTEVTNLEGNLIGSISKDMFGWSISLDGYKIISNLKTKTEAKRVFDTMFQSADQRPGYMDSMKDPIFVIGDLNGSLTALKRNLQSLQVVDENLKWIGPKATLIFIGDILGDRLHEGFECYEAIADLRRQIEGQGGTLWVICGNHDAYVLEYFIGDSRDILEQSLTQEDYLHEFKQFIQPDEMELVESMACTEFERILLIERGRPMKMLKGGEAYIFLLQQRELIWNRFKKAKPKVWGELQNLILTALVGENLFSHCPWAEPLSNLLRFDESSNPLWNAIPDLNEAFQASIKREELDMNLLKMVETDQRFYQSIFYTEDGVLFAEELREQGIRNLFFGHDRMGQDQFESPELFTKWGIRMVPTDFDYMGEESDTRRSIARVDSDGIAIGKDLSKPPARVSLSGTKDEVLRKLGEYMSRCSNEVFHLTSYI